MKVLKRNLCNLRGEICRLFGECAELFVDLLERALARGAVRVGETVQVALREQRTGSRRHPIARMT